MNYFIRFLLVSQFLFIYMAGIVYSQDTPASYLKQIKEWVRPPASGKTPVSYIDSTWNNWLERTGELPPDFDSMASVPFLPDPLVISDGDSILPIQNMEQWNIKKQQIKKEYQHWISGTIPPAPNNLKATILKSYQENRVTIEHVLLEFGPAHQGKITLELYIPPHNQPMPVLLTQWNHRGWAQIAVRRGYIGCIYAGADARDETLNYRKLFPEYDFARLMQRAWGCQRVLDYLYTRDEVDTNRIGITGHSRNSKQSLMAAAFDNRIDAIVASSGGTGGENAFRFTDKRYDNETIEKITYNFPDWFHPRLRFFVGREHKLPVDQNSLMALIAPRPLMLTTGLHEFQITGWGIEQVYRSVKKVYRFLDTEDNIVIRTRYGRHKACSRDIEAFIDFFDKAFNIKDHNNNYPLYYDYHFNDWKDNIAKHINLNDYPVINKPLTKNLTSKKKWEKQKKESLSGIHWLLGEEPAGIKNINPDDENRKWYDDHHAHLTGRPEFNDSSIGEWIVGPYCSMGDYLWANIYFPAKKGWIPDTTNGKMPLVVYLHEFNHGNGFAGKNIKPFVKKLTSKGFAVLAFDMIGFGTRIQEYAPFYKRYPKWSVMGKMVEDALSTVREAEKLYFLDADNVYLAGYSLGGTIGLFAGATADNIKGVISVAGFTPLRNNNDALEGIAAYSHLHGLMPKLGFFIDNPYRVPVDFDEILACIAPKKLLVIEPQHNRHADQRKITEYMKYVTNIYALYDKEENITFIQPATYDHFSEDMMDSIVIWLGKK